MKRLLFAVSLTMLGLVVVPASALAATAYVDVGGPLTTGCTTPASPCATITQGLTTAGPGGSVIVDDGGSYLEQVTIAGGQAVRVENFDGVPSGVHAFVDGGAGSAFTITGPGASLDKFDISGDVSGVQVDAANVTIRNGVFQEPTENNGQVQANLNATGLTLTGNVFIGAPTPADGGIGAALGAGGTLTDNSFEDLSTAVYVSGGPTLSFERNSVEAGGLVVDTADVDVEVASSTFSGGLVPGASVGIRLQQNGPGSFEASITRSRVTGYANGVAVFDTTGPVTVDDTLIAENPIWGLLMVDSVAGSADVTATNITTVGNGDSNILGGDLGNQNASLTLDSSIVGQAIDVFASASCAITFSRGPVIGSGCSGFQTSEDPRLRELDEFGDPDYSLEPGSAMIDAGNPASPAAALDLNGDPRALDGIPGCGSDVARRDIGADEFVPTAPDCTPPETTISGKPKAKVKSKKKRSKATFEFLASEAGSSFECSLDQGAFTTCSSGFEASVKAKKKFKPHSFRVAAMDAAGNRDLTPAEYKWKVKRKPKRRR